METSDKQKEEWRLVDKQKEEQRRVMSKKKIGDQ